MPGGPCAASRATLGSSRRPAGPSPVNLLEKQAGTARRRTRAGALWPDGGVPVFTFYRGAALIMASDLSSTKKSTGDHRCSVAGTPICRTSVPSGRRSASLVFDVNDFDETLQDHGNGTLNGSPPASRSLGQRPRFHSKRSDGASC